MVIPVYSSNEGFVWYNLRTSSCLFVFYFKFRISSIWFFNASVNSRVWEKIQQQGAERL